VRFSILFSYAAAIVISPFVYFRLQNGGTRQQPGEIMKILSAHTHRKFGNWKFPFLNGFFFSLFFWNFTIT